MLQFVSAEMSLHISLGLGFLFFGGVFWVWLDDFEEVFWVGFFCYCFGFWFFFVLFCFMENILEAA